MQVHVSLPHLDQLLHLEMQKYCNETKQQYIWRAYFSLCRVYLTNVFSFLLTGNVFIKRCISPRQDLHQEFHQEFQFLMRVAKIIVGIGTSDCRFWHSVATLIKNKFSWWNSWWRSWRGEMHLYNTSQQVWGFGMLWIDFWLPGDNDAIHSDK